MSCTNAEGAFQNVEVPRRGGSGSDSSWASLLALIGFIGLCLLARATAHGHATGATGLWLASLTGPPGRLPDGIADAAWTGSCVLNGLAAWRVWRRGGPFARRALRLWGWMVLASAVWTLGLAALHSVAAGTLALLPLFGLTVWTIRRFARRDGLAAALLIPYAAWIGYTIWCVAGLWWLN